MLQFTRSTIFFRTFNNQYPQNSDLKPTVKNIIFINFPLVVIRYTVRITHKISIEQFLFYPKWAIGRARFRTDINRLIITIISYRTNQYYLDWVRNNFNQFTVIITSGASIVIPETPYFIGNTPEFPPEHRAVSGPRHFKTHQPIKIYSFP